MISHLEVTELSHQIKWLLCVHENSLISRILIYWNNHQGV